MGCELTSERISDYYFGAVERAERAAMEGHLQECRSCLREFLFFKDAVETGAQRGETPGAAARERLFRAVRISLPPARGMPFRSPVWKNGAWVAAGLLAALSAGSWLHFFRERPAPERPIVAFHQLDTADTSPAEPVNLSVF